MSELIDVLDEKGLPIGVTKERELVHRDGDWHRTVHVWLLCGEELLLQLRGPRQESNPGLWDISCAGHLGAGESPEMGLRREFKEELGVDIGELNPYFLGELPSIWSSDEFLDREFNAVFLLRWEGRRPDIHFQREEIDDVAWVSWKDLEARVKAEDPSLVTHPQEFDLLFRYLSSSGKL